jgi:type II secretory pathway component PulF
MLFSIAADDRAALQFEDFVSSLDAGLPLATIGADPARGERAIHDALTRRGVKLSPTEDAVLQAAWKSGRIGEALRGRAADRLRRAEASRTLWAGVRYPLGLLAMLIVASFITVPVMGHYWFPIGVVGAVALAGGSAFALWRGLRRGDERWARLPVIGRIATDLAEIPYLESLHAMYGAGIPLVQAHSAAVAAVPLPAVRSRLQVTDRVLREGHPLAEALARSLALHPETRTLLETGEQAGQLEDALRRALQRRRDVSTRALVDAVRRTSAAVYLIVALAVAAIVLSFWTNLYARVGLIR